MLEGSLKGVCQGIEVIFIVYLSFLGLTKKKRNGNKKGLQLSMFSRHARMDFHKNPNKMTKNSKEAWAKGMTSIPGIVMGARKNRFNKNIFKSLSSRGRSPFYEVVSLALEEKKINQRIC